jgi:hypothetical protein
MLILLSGLAEFKHELIVAVISDEPKADASEKAKPGRFSRAVMLTHDLGTELVEDLIADGARFREGGWERPHGG